MACSDFSVTCRMVIGGSVGNLCRIIEIVVIVFGIVYCRIVQISSAHTENCREPLKPNSSRCFRITPVTWNQENQCFSSTVPTSLICPLLLDDHLARVLAGQEVTVEKNPELLRGIHNEWWELVKQVVAGPPPSCAERYTNNSATETLAFPTVY